MVLKRMPKFVQNEPVWCSALGKPLPAYIIDSREALFGFRYLIGYRDKAGLDWVKWVREGRLQTAMRPNIVIEEDNVSDKRGSEKSARNNEA